jgi:hypothetical protein
MRLKYAFLAVLVAFCLLSLSSVAGAVDAREIDTVRNKGVLGEADFKLIDQFVAEQVDELVSARSFSSISRVRMTLVTRNTSAMESAQAQYTGQFSESALKHISAAFKQAEGFSDEQKFRASINLMILIDGLADPRLASLAIERLASDNKAIRYWAVHSLTNEAFLTKLNTGGNSQLAGQVIDKLTTAVAVDPQSVALIAQFASKSSNSKADELLLATAESRIARYANWTVEEELVDADILKLLAEKMSSAANKAAFARRFGQLYSYVMQRYIEGKDCLTTTQKEHLASVLVEIETSCIGKMLQLPQSVIKRSIEQQDYAALTSEYSRLFGDGNTQGKLASTLKFDYGKGSDGKQMVSPVELPARPDNTKVAG